MGFGGMGAGRRFGAMGAPLGRAGTGGGTPAPNAPVLGLASEVAGLITMTWDVDNTVAAGDTLTRQVQVAGGNWSSLLDNTAHVITSGEADPITGGTITASQYQAPSNGSYDIRGYVTSAATGKTSVASNTLTVVVADALVGRLMWSTSQQLWSTDHLIWN